MNPANVLPWGCPWHGLVRGGKVTLPNGSLKSYPQPASMTFTSGPGGSTINRPQDTYGITHRHAAGLPPVSISAEDVAAGRQWRNEAIMSGGRYQVHGKQLDGWVYVDPDGARWLVRCSAINEQDIRSLTAPLSVSLTFLRFGVLGGTPAAWSFSVSLPLPDIGATGSAYLMFDAIKPDGSAAVINVNSRTFTARRMARVSIGFIELAISGPGSAPIITASVVRTNAQTQIVDPQPDPVINWWDGYSYQATETFAVVYSLEGEVTWSGRQLLALWYDAGGALQEVAQRAQATSTYSAPRPDNPGAGYSSSATASGSLDLMIGGAVVDSVSLDISVSVVKYAGSGAFTFSATLDGVTLSGNATVEPSFFRNYPFPDIGHVCRFFGTSAINAGGGAGYTLSFSPAGAAYFSSDVTSAAWFTAAITPYWYSRQVVGFEISTEAGAPSASTRRWRFRAPITPSGAATGATIDITTPTGPTFYGSHDPYSGAAVWGQSAPVCYV